MRAGSGASLPPFPHRPGRSPPEPERSAATPRAGRHLRYPHLSVRTFHASGPISFSTKGEYGVRMLVQLARRWAGEGTVPVSLAEVAAEEDLPRAYLEQLVIPLREADIVASTRGARGGYALARPPAEISLAEALRALEGPLAPMVCASEDPAHAGSCLRLGACSVNVLWVRVRDAISGVLDGTTLADLIPLPHLVELESRAGAAAAVPTGAAPGPPPPDGAGAPAPAVLDREPLTV